MTDGKTAPLKVAVVRPYFTESKGGAERYAVELVRGLVALGHSVHVFAYRWDRPEETGVAYHRVWMPRKPAWLRVLIFHWNLRRHLVHADYDAVLGMTPFWPQTVFWLGDGLYSVWTRVAWPNAVVRRFMCLKRAVMAVNLRLEKRMLTRETERFIAISRLVKHQAMRHYGVPEERIDTVYPAIDPARFNLEVRARWRQSVRRDLAIAGDEVVLLFAANNFRRKGLAPLIRAFGRVTSQARGLRLIVVGAGPVASFRRLARRCGVVDKVLFLNFVDAIEKYYAAADAFVLPTRYDPFGAVCLEAMACGLPVVTTRMAGAAELIESGKTGYVIGAGDQRMLESCIRSLSDGGRCATMGALGAERVKGLTNENHIQQIASVLDQTASARRANHSLQVVTPSAGFVINQDYLPLLERHGLGSLASIMEAEATRELFYNRTKQIALFRLSDRDATQTVFVKRHRVRTTFFERMKGLLDESVVPDGMKEWNNLLAFHESKLPAVTPVAAGSRLRADGVKESFVMTVALDNYRPLDEYIAERYVKQAKDPMQMGERRTLIRLVAAQTRRMHWTGFSHRDFYLCHIFVRKLDDEAFDLKIIDLRRAGYRKARRKRWWIKDLAQLHYSSLCLPLSDRDRLRFFVAYGGGLASRRARRRQLRRILRKSRAIARHDAKLRRFDDQSVPGPSWAEPRH